MEKSKSLQTKIYEIAIRRNSTITAYFKFVYALIILVLALGGYFTFVNHPLGRTFYQVGVNFGRAALVLLAIVVLPGILGRFQIEIPITRIITLFRRQLGITVFLLAFTHYQLVRGLLFYSKQMPFILPRPLFEFFGFWALTFLFLMFLTSNNFSVKKLGKWWKRLHRIVYLVLWLLVLHTGLQRISVWTYLIGIFAVLEIVSFFYSYLVSSRQRSSQTPEAKSS